MSYRGTDEGSAHLGDFVTRPACVSDPGLQNHGLDTSVVGDRPATSQIRGNGTPQHEHQDTLLYT